MRNKRPVEVRVELRPGAGEVIKPVKAKVDLYAVVEVRTGVVLRWSVSEVGANRVAERVRAGGPV